jgi:putative IMPACT (imprinted ancient) family translation regulator
MHDMEMLIMIDKGSYVTKIIAAVDKAGGIKLNKFRDLNFKEKQLVSSSTWAFFLQYFIIFTMECGKRVL